MQNKIIAYRNIKSFFPITAGQKVPDLNKKPKNPSQMVSDILSSSRMRLFWEETFEVPPDLINDLGYVNWQMRQGVFKLLKNIDWFSNSRLRCLKLSIDNI